MADCVTELQKPRIVHGFLGIIADMAGLATIAPLLPFHVPAEWVGPV